MSGAYRSERGNEVYLTRRGAPRRANAVLQVLSGYRGKEVVQKANEDTTRQLEDRERIANFFVSQELAADMMDGAALEVLAGKWDDVPAPLAGNGDDFAARASLSEDGGGAAADADGARGGVEDALVAPLEWLAEARARHEAMRAGAGAQERRAALQGVMAAGHQAYFEALLQRPEHVNEVRRLAAVQAIVAYAYSSCLAPLFSCQQGRHSCDSHACDRGKRHPALLGTKLDCR